MSSTSRCRDPDRDNGSLYENQPLFDIMSDSDEDPYFVRPTLSELENEEEDNNRYNSDSEREIPDFTDSDEEQIAITEEEPLPVGILKDFKRKFKKEVFSTPSRKLSKGQTILFFSGKLEPIRARHRQERMTYFEVLSFKESVLHSRYHWLLVDFVNDAIRKETRLCKKLINHIIHRYDFTTGHPIIGKPDFGKCFTFFKGLKKYLTR